MHVVQVIAGVHNESAGTTLWLRRLTEELHKRRIDVDIVSLTFAKAAPINLAGLTLYPEDKTVVPGFKTLLGSRDLKTAIFKAGVNGSVLHSSGLWRMPNVYAGWAAARTGCPLIVSPHGMLGPGAMRFSANKKKIFASLVQNRALEAVTCFHATSEKEVEDIRAYGLKAPIALIPNGIDVPADAANSKDPHELDTNDVPRRTLLYLGRVHPKKGLDKLIAAWARQEDRFPDWNLHVVGPSEVGHGDELRAQAKQAGIKKVLFCDGLFGEAKLRAYQDADLFVLPTLDENFGMVVAESLAAGTPVISTKAAPWGGLRTYGCGWWIDHGVEPLAAALSEAMALPRSDLKRMGARGRDWMRRDFSWSHIAADMEQLYRWCKDKGPPPVFVRSV